MKRIFISAYIVLFSGMLMALIITDSSTASADIDAPQVIRGIVLDQHTGEYLPGVKVLCEHTAKETYTDFDGSFSLPKMGVESVSLRFDYISYQSIRIENVLANEETLLVRLEQ